MIKSILHPFSRVSMSVLPTPIRKLKKISEDLSANIYCLRDDLTGFAFGGNKTRKLDFLIADAIKNNADTLIAIGANQSNFCRITAAAGLVHGIDVHLILGGKEPEKPSANLFLDHKLNAKIHHINTNDISILEKASEELTKELTAKKKKVYAMPLGGSSPIGVLGYVRALGHIINFSRQKEIFFNKIIHATGSGGTQSGLIVGQSIVEGWSGEIIGVSVGVKSQQLSEKIFKLANDTAKLLDVNPISNSDIKIDNNYAGNYYGERTTAGNEAIKYFAKREGIFLDNVYTAKAAAALIDYAKKGLFKDNENILFIHTGGSVQIFE